MTLLLHLFINGLVQGMPLACLAVGFGLVYRSLKIFHLAMGAQFILTGYILYALMDWFHMSLVTAVPLTLVLAVAFGALIEKAVYLPFFKKKSSAGVTMIASLGVMIIVENVIALIFGNNVKSISTDLEPIYLWHGLKVTRIQLIQFLICGACFGGLGYLIQRSKWFKVIWAMGDQPKLVPVMGLPLNTIRLVIMCLAAFMVAVPSVLIGYDVGLEPHTGMSYLLTASVAVFFGGLDRYWAWGIGAICVAILQSVVVWLFSGEWISFVTFAILVFVLLFKPNGLFGVRKRMEEE